ncbi:TetR/AcrR family transcriptional regulator [Paenibacillus arenosi]|nr:TetR/AcrR family transcriptional regulator [Paenibacillus arenosi]
MTSTKQSLIQAFVNLVNEKDFEKITIADLTKGAHVNRATFYAHFNDKYELLDYIVREYISTAIINRTKGEVTFDQQGIAKLVLALCDFYQQPSMNCRSSYIALVVPQLTDKAIIELRAYLLKGLESLCSAEEVAFYAPIFAQVIHESALQWATGKVTLDKEKMAERTAVLVVNGFHSSVSSLS